MGYLVPVAVRHVRRGGCGEADGVVVPPGAGLMPPAPAGPPQVEGEAGVADEVGGVLPGQACQAGRLGDGELDRGDAGRAGLAGPGGDGRVAEGDAQFSGTFLLQLLLLLASNLGFLVVQGFIGPAYVVLEPTGK